MSRRLSHVDMPTRNAQDEYSRAIWRTSSRCGAYGTCVEVAQLPDGDVGMRDNKDPSGPVLRFTTAQWRDFVASVHSGEFDQ